MIRKIDFKYDRKIDISDGMDSLWYFDNLIIEIVLYNYI